MTDLYSPPDVSEANSAWGANCGPCAFAAILRMPVMEVQDYFPAFPSRPWTNPTAMKAALDAVGISYCDTLREYKTRFPLYGLAFVQIGGPWTRPGSPVAAAYRHTHWVAISGSMVYDGNAEEWLIESDWRTEVMNKIVSRNERATGWWVRSGIEVKKS